MALFTSARLGTWENLSQLGTRATNPNLVSVNFRHSPSRYQDTLLGTSGYIVVLFEEWIKLAYLQSRSRVSHFLVTFIAVRVRIRIDSLDRRCGRSLTSPA